MSGDYGNLGLDFANGQLGGSFNNGALGLGMHDGKWTGETNIGPINLDYGNGQWGGGMALGGSNVSYGNGGWSGTVEGNFLEQGLGETGLDTSGFEITDVSYNANEGWTGAFSNEFGTVNQDGKYSATVIPDDGDQSTTWPAVQEAATGVKTTISDLWTSIFGGEKPPAEQQQEVVENTGPQQPTNEETPSGTPNDETTPNNGEPAKEEQATERQMPPRNEPQKKETNTGYEESPSDSIWPPSEYMLGQIAAEQPPGKSLRIKFPEIAKDVSGGVIERQAGAKGMSIAFSDGTRIDLASTADFRQLIGTGILTGLRSAPTAEKYLDGLVSAYYDRFKKDAGALNAKNERGSASFSFAGASMEQVLRSEPSTLESQYWAAYRPFKGFLDTYVPTQNEVNAFRDWMAFVSEEAEPTTEPQRAEWRRVRELAPGSISFTFAETRDFLRDYGPRMTPGDPKYERTSILGLECQATAAVYELKTLGIVPPDMSREEFEVRYTNLHTGVRLPEALEKLRQLPGPRLPNDKATNEALRFGGDRATNPSVRTAWANILRDSDWGKLTGATMFSYTSEPRTYEEAKDLVEAGKPVYAAGSMHSKLWTGNERVHDPMANDRVQAYNPDAEHHKYSAMVPRRRTR